MKRRHVLKIPAVLCAPLIGAAFSSCSTFGRKKIDESCWLDRLFVLDTWFWENNWDAEQQCRMLRRLNIRKGTDCRSQWEAFPKVIEAFDQNKVELTAVYIRLSIDDHEIPPFIPPLLKKLEKRGTLLWITPTSKQFGPSDPAGDPFAAALIREISIMAEKADLPISLYHHRGDWLERAGDAHRVACKVDRGNVGCTFNLYHWLCIEGPDDLKLKAESVLPKLNCITVNGSMNNAGELDVRKAILPLGEGDYSVEHFLRTFESLGYRGLVGLQGYGIGGDVYSKLEKSLHVWRDLYHRIYS